jgi:hypothetical protein
MVRRYYFVLFLFSLQAFFPLFAVQDLVRTISELKARDVGYDGRKIRLTGEVSIDHRLGLITCDKAELLMPEESVTGKSLTPERIFLQKGVKLVLKDGSTLSSDDADINCLDLSGVFTADAPNKVVYTTFVEEDGKKLPVITSSRAMHITMKKDENTAQYVLSDIQGEGAVSIQYQNGGKL